MGRVNFCPGEGGLARPLLAVRSLSPFLCCVVALLGCGCGPSKPDPRNLKVAFDQILSFAAAAGTERFRRSGWSPSEQAFTWTDGRSARLRFELRPVKAHVGIRMRLTGLFKAPQLAAQTVRVWVNGTKITEWNVAATSDFRVIVPMELLRPDGRLDIKLELPFAVSPKALGISEDPRILGVRCSEVEITRAVQTGDIWPHEALGGR